MNIKSINNFIHEKIDDSIIEFLNIFDNSSYGVIVVDTYGNIKYINNEYAKLFKVEMNNYIDKKIYYCKNDEIILESLRLRKEVTGRLEQLTTVYDADVSAFPIIRDGKFEGIFTTYNKIKNSGSEVSKLNVKYYEDFEVLDSFKEIIGQSKNIKIAIKKCQKIAKTDATVLIIGESGTGKELFAKAIYKESKRKDKPFVVINCGAIPTNLIESELFGHEKGSFTGAISKKIGKFEQADKGTIFLDEIGELPLNVQVKLLRVIQEQEFNRVGGSEDIKINTRIIAATNKNLSAMIKENTFREDLYYRLNVIPVELPSLREHNSDIELMIESFSKKISKSIGIENVEFSKEVIEIMVQYDWPGNVRELINIIERMIILSEDGVIRVEDLPKCISQNYGINETYKTINSGLINLKHTGEMATMKEYEKEIIKNAMKMCKSYNAAGKLLGLTHKTVASKSRKYNIEY